MSKSHALKSASPPPKQLRKKQRGSNLSFKDITSIDFAGLIKQAPCTPWPDDGGDPPDAQDVAGEIKIANVCVNLAPDETAAVTSVDGPTAWVFESPFYSITEAATWLNISLATMKRLLARGTLPFVRVGERRKIPLSALRAYVICEHAGAALPSPNSLSNSIPFNS